MDAIIGIEIREWSQYVLTYYIAYYARMHITYLHIIENYFTVETLNF